MTNLLMTMAHIYACLKNFIYSLFGKSVDYGYVLPRLEKVVKLRPAYMTYMQPSYVELLGLFHPYVPFEFKGKVFEPIVICNNVKQKNGRKLWFEYVEITTNVYAPAILADMASKGLRPALYEEMLDYIATYPMEQLVAPIVALGSYIEAGQMNLVAYAGGHNKTREIYLGWLGGMWSPGYRFLAVKR